MSRPVLVTARLVSPLAGDAPRLDSLLQATLAVHHAKKIPGSKIDRAFPLTPDLSTIPIPLARQRIGGWDVACCSWPILGPVHEDKSEYVTKKIATENAAMLAPQSRTVVTTTNSWTKSYRLPLRTRLVERVAWFAVVDGPSRLRQVLKRVESIGKKPSIGYGRVAEWTVEPVEEDHSWFAPSPAGPVLMTALPAGDWLPSGLVGYRRDFGACVSPYWHQDRYTEIVVPC